MSFNRKSVIPATCILRETLRVIRSQGTLRSVMCQPGWERGSRENGYIYMDG